MRRFVVVGAVVSSVLLFVVVLAVPNPQSPLFNGSPKDYWEWRDHDRANALYYQTLAQFAPRAMLLNGYYYHRDEFAQLLNTDFGYEFWGWWAISPQVMLAKGTLFHPQCGPHGWLCTNWMLLMAAHAIAEISLFVLVLNTVGLAQALQAWSGHILRRLIFAQLGTYLTVWLLFPFIPFWLCDFFNSMQVYAAGPIAMVEIPILIVQHAGLGHFSPDGSRPLTNPLKHD